MGGGGREGEEDEHEELFKCHLEVKMSDVPLKPAFTALTEEKINRFKVKMFEMFPLSQNAKKMRNRKVKGQMEGNVKRKTRARRRAM